MRGRGGGGGASEGVVMVERVRVYVVSVGDVEGEVRGYIT